MKSSLLVFVGAGLGGLMRHFLNGWITALAGVEFPYGILAINVLGSTAMGLVAGWLAFRSDGGSDVRLFLATGILGGFTTFSAFSLDTVLLIERGQAALASFYVVGTVALSVAGLFAGLWATRAVLG